MKLRLRKLRLYDLPLLYYWRTRTVRREALQDPDKSLWKILKWFIGEQRHYYLSRIITADDKPVGYVQVTHYRDMGVYIGGPGYLARGIGTFAVDSAVAEFYGKGGKVLSCGTDVPGWASRFGFVAWTDPVNDNGVWRTPMKLELP